MDATSMRLLIQQTKMFSFFFSLIMNDDYSLASYLYRLGRENSSHTDDHVSTASPDDLGYLSQKASSSSPSSSSKETTTKQTLACHFLSFVRLA